MILPTLNEGPSVGRVIELLLEGDASTDVLVVDDASTDDTVAAVERFRGERVALIERPSPLGLGSAYLIGFAWALERPYEAVVEMDSDLSHDPRDALRLVAALDNADVVIGSRYVPGGRVENWGMFRRALSVSGNRYPRASCWGSRWPTRPAACEPFEPSGSAALIWRASAPRATGFRSKWPIERSAVEHV